MYTFALTGVHKMERSTNYNYATWVHSYKNKMCPWWILPGTFVPRLWLLEVFHVSVLLIPRTSTICQNIAGKERVTGGDSGFHSVHAMSFECYSTPLVCLAWGLIPFQILSVRIDKTRRINNSDITHAIRDTKQPHRPESPAVTILIY